MGLALLAFPNKVLRWGSKNGEKKFHWINWNQCCQPKKSGGLGFRRFKAFNVALLAKQGWRLVTNPESLVAKCLKARYFPRGDVLKAKVGYRPSYTWRSIQHATWVIKKGGLWRVGKGHFIDIWEDNWLPLQNGFRIWSTKPVGCDICIVSQLINHEEGGWNEQLINDLFLPFEAVQILQIPLPVAAYNDTFSWGYQKNSNFTVKSAYNCIKRWEASDQQGSSHGVDDQFWKNLWSLKTIPKHIHLAWRIIHDGLPLRKSLFHRGVNCSPMCPRCDNCVEDINHAFQLCDWSRKIWLASPLGIRFNGVNHEEFIGWLKRIIMQEPHDVIETVLAICYGIWNARNKLCFEAKQLNPTDVLQKGLTCVQDYKIACLVNGAWGVGCVIRDTNGYIMAAATWRKFSLPDSDVAEALGMRLGLMFARDLGFFNLQAETDSLNVVWAMKNESTSTAYFGRPISDCRLISSGLSCFDINHVKREGNILAHRLAKFALHNCDNVWIEDIPDCTADVWTSDLRGV